MLEQFEYLLLSILIRNQFRGIKDSYISNMVKSLIEQNNGKVTETEVKEKKNDIKYTKVKKTVKGTNKSPKVNINV